MSNFEKFIVWALVIETVFVGMFIYSLLKMVDVCLVN